MVTNDDIKNAALSLFAFRGYEATSIQDIADAVGFKKPSFYSHFTSKSELYIAILRDQTRLINEEIDRSLEQFLGKPVEALLRGVFDKLVSVFSKKERLLLWKRTFLLYASQEGLEIIQTPDWQFDRHLRDRLYEIIAERHDSLKEPSTFQAFFFSYMLLFQSYLDWMVVKAPDERLTQEAWRNYWNGSKHYFQKT